MQKINFDTFMGIIFLTIGVALIIGCYHIYRIIESFNLLLAIPCISGFIMIFLSVKIFRIKKGDFK